MGDKSNDSPESESTVQSDNQNTGALCENVEDFVQEGFKCLINATKSSNRLPFGKARNIYESYPIFHTLMKKSSERVLSQLSILLKHAGFRSNIQNRDDDEKIEIIADINDTLLGRVGTMLDEISGIRTQTAPKPVTSEKTEPVSGSWNIKSKTTKYTAAQVLNEVFEKTKNIDKPQENFKDRINNDRNSIFEPKIKYKYNMLKPLALTEEIGESGNIRFSHPYQFELEHFNPPKEQLAAVQPILYKSLTETPFHFITKPEEIKDIINDCKNYKEIAVDMENIPKFSFREINEPNISHHSYRSFEGFTCLLQISTRDTDYIIDALVLRNDMEELNEIFTDPKIVKVFHGADSDLMWLQRDLGLYVVNLFDTFEAVKLLNYPRHSLAYLLLKFCNVDPEKHFQLADWRVRPLPEPLIMYARGDTHYLLYIYDNLKNLLIEKSAGKTNILEAVISNSTKKCLKQVYEKPEWSEDGYLTLYHKSKKLFDNRQKYAMKCLYEWRDNIARTHDESYGYVLPNHMMLQISEALPREAQGILACCNPVPVLVRKYLLALHQIILKARDKPLVEPVFEERQLYRYTAENNLVPSNQLNCPHDLNHESEFRDDLPVLIPNNSALYCRDESLVCSKPIINVFEQTGVKRNEILRSLRKTTMLTPFQRYKLTKPFTEKREISNIEAQKSTASKKETVEKVEVIDVKPLTKQEPEETSETEKSGSLAKRKAEEKYSTQSKKVKLEGNLVRNPYYKKPDPVKDQAPKQKEEKKKRPEIEPFNYSSINFDKFQTHVKSDPKRNKRHKKSYGK